MPSQQIRNFIAYLSLKGFSQSTASNYVAGIVYEHKIEGHPNPADNFVIRKMLEGYKRLKYKKDIREPITTPMLQAIVCNLPGVCKSQYEVALFSAAILLGFFGLLRISEYTAPSKHDSQRTLQFQDIHIGKDLTIAVHISRSKTDQRGQGKGILIEPCSNQTLCPSKALDYYISNYRSRAPGPLFLHADGTPLTSFQFAAILKKAVAAAGFSTTGKTTHSLRIGACSMASARGITDAQIKQMGRWTSRAYKSYIRIPSNRLASLH